MIYQWQLTPTVSLSLQTTTTEGAGDAASYSAEKELLNALVFALGVPDGYRHSSRDPSSLCQKVIAAVIEQLGPFGDSRNNSMTAVKFDCAINYNTLQLQVTNTRDDKTLKSSMVLIESIAAARLADNGSPYFDTREKLSRYGRLRLLLAGDILAHCLSVLICLSGKSGSHNVDECALIATLQASLQLMATTGLALLQPDPTKEDSSLLDYHLPSLKAAIKRLAADVSGAAYAYPSNYLYLLLKDCMPLATPTVVEEEIRGGSHAMEEILKGISSHRENDAKPSTGEYKVKEEPSGEDDLLIISEQRKPRKVLSLKALIPRPQTPVPQGGDDSPALEIKVEANGTDTSNTLIPSAHLSTSAISDVHSLRHFILVMLLILTERTLRNVGDGDSSDILACAPQQKLQIERMCHNFVALILAASEAHSGERKAIGRIFRRFVNLFLPGPTVVPVKVLLQSPAHHYFTILSSQVTLQAWGTAIQRTREKSSGTKRNRHSESDYSSDSDESYDEKDTESRRNKKASRTRSKNTPKAQNTQNTLITQITRDTKTPSKRLLRVQLVAAHENLNEIDNGTTPMPISVHCSVFRHITVRRKAGANPQVAKGAASVPPPTPPATIDYCYPVGSFTTNTRQFRPYQRWYSTSAPDKKLKQGYDYHELRDFTMPEWQEEFGEKQDGGPFVSKVQHMNSKLFEYSTVLQVGPLRQVPIIVHGKQSMASLPEGDIIATEVFYATVVTLAYQQLPLPSGIRCLLSGGPNSSTKDLVGSWGTSPMTAIVAAEMITHQLPYVQAPAIATNQSPNDLLPYKIAYVVETQRSVDPLVLAHHRVNLFDLLFSMTGSGRKGTNSGRGAQAVFTTQTVVSASTLKKLCAALRKTLTKATTSWQHTLPHQPSNARFPPPEWDRHYFPILSLRSSDEDLPTRLLHQFSGVFHHAALLDNSTDSSAAPPKIALKIQTLFSNGVGKERFDPSSVPNRFLFGLERTSSPLPDTYAKASADIVRVFVDSLCFMLSCNECTPAVAQRIVTIEEAVGKKRVQSLESPNGVTSERPTGRSGILRLSRMVSANASTVSPTSGFPPPPPIIATVSHTDLATVLDECIVRLTGALDDTDHTSDGLLTASEGEELRYILSQALQYSHQIGAVRHVDYRKVQDKGRVDDAVAIWLQGYLV